ncbi:unnamed protein product [Ixodes persulcatus]
MAEENVKEMQRATIEDGACTPWGAGRQGRNGGKLSLRVPGVAEGDTSQTRAVFGQLNAATAANEVISPRLVSVAPTDQLPRQRGQPNSTACSCLGRRWNTSDTSRPLSLLRVPSTGGACLSTCN